MADYRPIVANMFLFFLIFGLSGTVDFSHFKRQIKNKKAILTGLLLQFIILPFLGFLVVKITKLDYIMGITLLIITSSPGGAYSNWFCSIFNADLALSVTMTAISTILSVAMLPLNVLLYSRLAFDGDVLDSLDWHALGISLAVVVAAITSGLFISAKYGKESPKLRSALNKAGNVAGLGLIIFTSVAPEGGSIDLSGRELVFYFGTILPIVFGLLASILISSLAGLNKPERVTVSVECVYQNTGIAMTSCLALFDGADEAYAIGVPFWYTGMQTLFVGIYCLVAWKMGWTKAPANENIFKVLFRSYEVEEEQCSQENTDSQQQSMNGEGAPLDDSDAEQANNEKEQKPEEVIGSAN
eukprot:CAMPEP_0197256228 /NCGR_PEP_ID=MMETSP1429-20130617/74706_1 /TAXON_ID=49237 /ORGANISM="Chaetoceros  sp., Strain UNC1202" /LENGTH=356 /DNA_ID=CAMNT_0042719739 /DNA_START=73 /DNA_END=1143 /DNA_ORIENTATION=-